MALVLAMALSMPQVERRTRHEVMMDKLKTHGINDWFADFVGALQDSGSGLTSPRPEPPMEEPPPEEPSSMWQRRTA